MTSQISIRKLLKQEIRQSGWMFGLTGLAHLLTGPVVFLLSTSNYQNWSNDTAINRYNSFFTDNYFIWQLLTMLGCLLVSIFIYRYLFSRRMVDLYHSVPISRSRLFAVKYLHGFLIWFIPFALNVGCIFLFLTFRSLGRPYYLTALGSLCKVATLLLLCFLILYHLFLAAVYISGNVLNMFANMGIIGCSVIAGSAALYILAENFDTFCYRPTNILLDILYGLSPLTSPFAIYAFSTSDSLGKHLPLLIISLVICLMLLYLAWTLYKKRPSELAENGTRIKAYIYPARTITTIVAGIAGALFFSSISIRDNRIAWGIFGALLCTIVSFGTINSIYRTTIKHFFKQWKQLILSSVVTVSVVLIFQLDLVGYDSYIPDKEKIEGMSIYCSSFSDGSSNIILNENSYTPFSSIASSEGWHVKQANLLTDPDICYDLLDTVVNPVSGSGYTSFYAKIKLKNGFTYERSYRIADEDYAKLKPFIESEDYIKTNYKYSTGMFGYPDNLTLELENTHIDLNPSQNTLAKSSIQKIMDAYWIDFAKNFSLESMASKLTIFSFSGSYGTDENYFYFALNVPSTYENTIKTVEELYPEYSITIKDSKEIISLDIDTNYYDKISGTHTTLESLYEYFGYPVNLPASEPESDIAVKSEGTIIYPSVDVKPLPTVETYFALTITDREILDELFPLLYFGNYRDTFSMKEYIHLGYVQTLNGNSISCYVKPETLPGHIIEMIYKAERTYEY